MYPNPNINQLNDSSFWVAIAAEGDGQPLTHGPQALLPVSHTVTNRKGGRTGNTGRDQRLSDRSTQHSTLCIALLFLVSFVLLLSVLGQGQPSPLSHQAALHTHLALLRLNQWDTHQYRTPGDVAVWGPSACSAAALTEYIDSFGFHYRIGDILAVEIETGQITPQLGLLYGYSSIETTVSHAPFHFQAIRLSRPSLEDVITKANQGVPVIVSFPPSTWPGGHILLVRGGNATQVNLVDSSRLYMKVMTRRTFLTYWRGFAVTLQPK